VQFPQIKRYHLQQNNFQNRKKLVIGGRDGIANMTRPHDFCPLKMQLALADLFFFLATALTAN